MNERNIKFLKLTKGGNKIMSEKVSREELLRDLEFERITKEAQEKLESTLTSIRDKREISHYHQQSNFVTQSPVLSVTHKAVYNVIVSFAYGNKVTARPLRETIAEMAPCSEKSVSNSVKFLQEIGLIQIEVVHFQGKTRNIYILLPIDDEVKAKLKGEKKEKAEEKPKAEKAPAKTPAKPKQKAKKIQLSEKLIEKLDGKTTKKAMETIESNEEVVSTLETLFRLDKKNKYKGEARPGEVVKVYLHTLKKGEVLNENQMSIVDALLVKGYQAKPIMNTISKGLVLGSEEFKKALDDVQEFQNKMGEAIVEIKTFGAMDKSRMIKEQLELGKDIAKPKKETISTVDTFEGFNVEALNE